MVASGGVAFKGAAGGAFAGGGLARLREHNCAAVLRALLDQGPRSRAQLVRTLGLAPSAMSYITGDLIEAGFVAERPAGAAGPRGRGRQAVPLVLVPDARYVVAVHLGPGNVDVGLVNLQGTPVHVRSLPLDRARWGPDPARLAADLGHQAQRLLAQAGVPAAALLGVGVGIAGRADGALGLVRHHAGLGWEGVPLAALLGQTMDLPTVVDDQIPAIGLAEAWFGAGRGADGFALLFVGAVVGTSVVSGRRAHRGHHAAAGRVGVLPAGSAPGGPDLESAVSELALYRAGRALAAAHPDSVLRRWLDEPRPGAVPFTNRLAELVGESSAAGRPDRLALDLLTRRAQDLAPLVAQLIATFDPEILALAGPIATDRDRLQLGLLREAVLAHAPGLAGRLPALEPSAFGTHWALIGAATLVLQEVYSPPLAGAQHGTPQGAVAEDIRRRARAST